MTLPILEIQDLSMKFGGIVALERVQFCVQPGTITSLIGPNGAGKTTIFNCCTGIYRPSKGDVKMDIDGELQSIVELTGRSMQRTDYYTLLPAVIKKTQNLFRGTYRVNQMGLARTFQNMRLFKNMTLVENLLVAQHRHLSWNLLSGIFQTKTYQARHREGLEKAYFWLKRLGLEADAQKLAGSLPYGRARMLEIARAMCTGPKLICLDEPAAGLNPAETLGLGETIIELKQEFPITVFLIEHDMSMVMSISDYIIVLDHGKLIAEGKPEEIKNNQHVIDAYLGKE